MVGAIDLVTLSDRQLKAYSNNCKRLGETEKRCAAVSEMFNRGIANDGDFEVFNWNQESVRSAMKRFKQEALAVKDNQRTAYTEAGGLKIGRAKGDPDKKWICTYCAIKTSDMNAVFVCNVKMPGDEPEFELHVDGTRVRSYNGDQLDDAFEEWLSVARRVQR
jgi:hypothetical protein